jgi:probable rRNA maturation factor
MKAATSRRIMQMKASEPSMPSTSILIENEQDKIQADEELINAIRRTILSCLEFEGFDTPCEINVTLTDNDNIKDINRQFRNIDAATDVLSFPMLDMQDGRLTSTEGDMDLDNGLLLLGDIVISLERALQQAEEYGHSFMREVAFLTSHGIFHLLGYDHMDSEQEKNMFGRQEAVLEKLGFVRQ